MPALKPFDFAMVNGKLLIVKPSDKKIVEVIERLGQPATVSVKAACATAPGRSGDRARPFPPDAARRWSSSGSFPGFGVVDGLAKDRGRHRLRTRLPPRRIRPAAHASDRSRAMTFELALREAFEISKLQAI